MMLPKQENKLRGLGKRSECSMAAQSQVGWRGMTDDLWKSISWHDRAGNRTEMVEGLESLKRTAKVWTGNFGEWKAEGCWRDNAGPLAGSEGSFEIGVSKCLIKICPMVTLPPTVPVTCAPAGNWVRPGLMCIEKTEAPESLVYYEGCCWNNVPGNQS